VLKRSPSVWSCGLLSSLRAEGNGKEVPQNLGKSKGTFVGFHLKSLQRLERQGPRQSAASDVVWLSFKVWWPETCNILRDEYFLDLKHVNLTIKHPFLCAEHRAAQKRLNSVFSAPLFRNWCHFHLTPP
jgi:hypothetical protein